MLLKSIRLRNIRSYLDEKIDFPVGTTLLSGDIGCGKSTILMAVDFALFGIRKGELSGSDLLRHGKDEGSIELELELDSKSMGIRRSLKRGSAISQESCVLVTNGVSESLMPVELKARVLEMLGYPQELVKKNKPIFRYTVYTPQEEMKKILSDEASRLDILRKIFNIDKYGVIRANARVFLTELRSMKRELEAYSKDLEIRAMEKKESEDLLDAVHGQIYGFSSRISSLNARHDGLKARIDAMKVQMEDFRKLQISIAKKESEAGALKRKLADIDNELSNIESKIQFNVNLFSEPVSGDMNSTLESLKLLERDRDGMLKNMAVIDAEADRLSSIYSEGLCSFCGQSVSDPASFKGRIDERKGKRQEIMDGIRQLDESLDIMKKQRAVLEKYGAVKRTIDDLKSWRSDKQAESLRAGTAMKEAEQGLLEARDAVKKYDSIEPEYRKAELEMAALQKDKLEMEKSLSRLEQQKEDAARRLASLEAEIREKQAARQKMDDVSFLLSWFDNFILLMENIEKHVLLTVQKEFDQYFQYWFSILMDDALSVRIDERFTPVIDQNGYETSFENLSGGEKTAVSLAYRLALNKVINIMIDSIRTKDLIILDEPTDGFSTDQLDKVRDVIHALGLKQVIIVSHEPKIDTYVENVLKVYKENHISHVVAQ